MILKNMNLPEICPLHFVANIPNKQTKEAFRNIFIQILHCYQTGLMIVLN